MLKIATGNKKTGPAFSLPEGVSCPGKTERCAQECYAKTGRMAMHYDKRLKQFQEVAGLKADFPIQLAHIIKGFRYGTIRIHDAGDFYSPTYTRYWQDIVRSCTDTKFWAYTRSWSIPGILEELIILAQESNCAIWLSSDGDNWVGALATYKSYPGIFAGIAFMEQEDTQDIAAILARSLPAKNFVNFPVHGHFGRVKVKNIQEIPNCPAITKQIDHGPLPACLTCKKCLPS